MISTASSVMMSARLDHAAFMPVDADGARLLAGVLDHEALDVEDDVGDVFHNAGDGADFVLHALDLDARDGTALQAGEQNAPQAIADGDAEAALERLGAELAVGVSQRATVADDAVGKLQSPPTDTHGLTISSRCYQPQALARALASASRRMGPFHRP